MIVSIVPLQNTKWLMVQWVLHFYGVWLTCCAVQYLQHHNSCWLTPYLSAQRTKGLSGWKSPLYWFNFYVFSADSGAQCESELFLCFNTSKNFPSKVQISHLMIQQWPNRQKPNTDLKPSAFFFLTFLKLFWMIVPDILSPSDVFHKVWSKIPSENSLDTFKSNGYWLKAENGTPVRIYLNWTSAIFGQLLYQNSVTLSSFSTQASF